MQTVKRPALSYYGGKWRLAPWIISHFPKHDNYLEPCGGAASVLLQKPRSLLETYNDLDGNVVNFFRVLRDSPEELIKRIRLTPWARVEYELSRDCLSEGDEIERARRLWVASWQSISGGPDPKQCSSGWRRWAEADNNRMDTDAWLSLEVIAQRFTGVQIENRDALKVIREYDNPKTLIYFDPPYVPQERTHSKQYRIDQGIGFHIEAAELLQQVKGYVVISGYNCVTYQEQYERYGWARFDTREQTNGSGFRTESIWLNPQAVEALKKPSQPIQLDLMGIEK